VNERRTVVGGGVDWPLDWPSISLHGWKGHTCVPPTVERDRRACSGREATTRWCPGYGRPAASDASSHETVAKTVAAEK